MGSVDKVVGSSAERLTGQDVKKAVDLYTGLYQESTAIEGEKSTERKQSYMALVNSYYDLVTDFYEYGWGRSFHFAHRAPNESFQAAITRHQHYIAARMNLRPGMTVLDLGCGVGGPMQEIARFSGATIVGVNNNAYQLGKANTYLREAGLTEVCSTVQSDYMDLPFEDESVDGAYFIDSSCHAPSRAALFQGVERVLKPGGVVASYEWCTTDRYDASNAEHRRVIQGIEEGDALPELISTHQSLDAFRSAGLEIVEAQDLADVGDPSTPWWMSLTGKGMSLRGFPRTPLGRSVTSVVTRVLEFARIAPKGTTEVSEFLNRGADALKDGGEQRIFTPMFLVVARKPE